MIVRDFRFDDPLDGIAVDRLIEDNRGHNVRLQDDFIMVVDSGSKTLAGEPILSGLIVARPVMYTHELIISDPSSAMKRIIAEQLIAHAISKASMIGERYAHFTVDTKNIVMRSFIESHGAIQQPDGVLYELEIPKAYYPIRGQRGNR